MTEKRDIYRCEICGNVVEVLHEGGGQLVCCGKPMKLLEEKSKEEGFEKHLPVVTKTQDGISVKVGEVAHPMDEKHFIEWIEVISEDKSFKKFLKPGQKPEADFKISHSKPLMVRIYCNIHGVWQK
jgi:superoxide reductase